MKKNLKKGISLFVAILTLISVLPISVKAKTISEFEQEVNNYTAELQAKKDKIAKNDAEIANIQAKIKEIGAQIEEISKEKDRLQQEIDDSNKQIELKGQQSKDIMKYYQVSEGNNSYLEYIFGADSITDMIYRYSVVQQLTEANKQIMDDLKKLIEENKKKKEELTKKDEELTKLKADLKEQQDRLGIENKGIRDSMPSLEEQIKSAKANLNYYKNLGCRNNEDIQDCLYRTQQSSGGSIPSTGVTLRPTEMGYLAGGLGSYWGHTGQDIGSSRKKGETIYPIADGYIIAVYNDNCYSFCGYTCNGNANIVVIRHNINNRYIYASYVHLSTVNFGRGYTGYISRFTPIGNMGNSGCTSGGDEGGTYIHLHLELATCHWQTGGGCTWGQYQNSIVNPVNYVNFPYSWNNR